jgi:peptidoglycan hydrolase-like protein with peptidoglycan-binding domain
VGLSGSDVTELQSILVKEGLLTPDSVTGFYGPKTEGGVKAFQAKYGIVSSGDPLNTGYGATGPSTRKKLEEKRGGTITSVSTPPPPSSTKGIILTRTLFVGSRGADVTTLQTYLIGKGYLPQGNTTGYFGKLTEAGVKAFQKAKGLEPVGWTGPKTRVEMGR